MREQIRKLLVLVVLFALSFSPSYARAEANDNGTALWDLTIGARQQLGYNELHAIALSPNGALAVTAVDQFDLRIWDTSTGMPVGNRLRHHKNFLTRIAWSQDGETIASGDASGLLVLWNKAGTPITATQTGKKPISALALSPHGSHIATLNEKDKSIHLWHHENNVLSETRLNGHKDAVTALDFSPDGKMIISAGADKSLRFWDVKTGNEIGSPISLNSTSWKIAINPAHPVVAVAAQGTIELWDYKSKIPAAPTLTRPYLGLGSAGMTFSGDGDRLMGGDSNGTVTLLNWRTGHLIAEGVLDYQMINAYAFSTNSDLVVSAGLHGKLVFWKAGISTSNFAVSEIKPDERIQQLGRDGAVFTPDGRYVAFGTAANRRVQETESGKILFEIPSDPNSTSLAISPDGNWLAASSANGIVTRLWNIPDRKLVMTVNEGPKVVFSPDSTSVAIGGYYAEKLVIYECKTGRKIAENDLGLRRHESPAPGDYSPDGKTLLVSSSRQIYRLDAKTLSPIGEPLYGMPPNAKTHFSPDGNRFMVTRGPENAQIVALDTKTGSQLTELMVGHIHMHNAAIQFTPDSRFLLSAGEDGLVGLWDAETGKKLYLRKRWQWLFMRNMQFTMDGKFLTAIGKSQYLENGQPAPNDIQASLHKWNISIPKNRPEMKAKSNMLKVLPPTASELEGFYSYEATIAKKSGLLVAASANRLWFFNRGDIREFEIKVPVNNNEPERIDSVSVSHDGHFVAAGTYSSPLRIFDAATGQLISKLKGLHRGLHGFTANGTLVLAKDNRIQLVNPKTGKPLRSISYQMGAPLTHFTAGNQQSVVAMGSKEGTLLIGHTDKEVTPTVIRKMHQGDVTAATFSSDDRFLATGGKDGYIQLINVQTGKPLFPSVFAHRSAVTTIAFSRDGARILSGSTDGTLRIFDAISGKPITFELIGHSTPILAITFDQETGDILTFGADDPLMRRWHIP